MMIRTLCRGVAALLGAALPAIAADPGPAFTLDMTALRRVEPKWLTWIERAPIRLDLANPIGLAALPDGAVAVVAARRLIVFEPDGRTRREIELEEAGRCVAAARNGELAVGFASRLAVYGTDGRLKTETSELGEEAILTSVAVTSNRLFAADAGQRIVWVFDRTGRLLRRVGERDPARGVEGLVVPSPHLDVWADDDGTVWVTNPGNLRLERFSADGAPLRKWGAAGFEIERFCGCCNPTDFTRLPGGAFVTSEKGLPRVKVHDPDGRLTSVVAGPADFDANANGLDVAADPKGRVMVLDAGRRQIRVFEPKTR